MEGVGAGTGQGRGLQPETERMGAGVEPQHNYNALTPLTEDGGCGLVGSALRMLACACAWDSPAASELHAGCTERWEPLMMVIERRGG